MAYQPAPQVLARFPAEIDARTLQPLPAGSPVTDAALLAAALHRAPALATAQAGYNAALAAANTARVPPPGSISLTAEYAREAGVASPWLLGIGSDLPLDRGGRRSARVEAADIAVLLALYSYGEALWKVRSDLRHAHIERSAAEREIELAGRLVAIRRDRADKLSLRVSAGEDGRPAALLALRELAAAEQRHDEAGGRRRQADAALAAAVGVTPAAVSTIGLAPLATAAPPVPADLAAARTEAALSRLDVLRAVADYDAAEAALRLEVAKQYPELRIGPGYTWERGVTKLPFTLSLGLPPRDMNRAGIAEAEARRSEAGRKLEAAQAAILAAVDQSLAASAAAQAVLRRVREEDLPLVTRTAAIARRSLAAGETDRIEDDAAQAAVIETALTELDAWRRTWMAIADLEDALRRSADPDEVAVLEAAMRSLKEDR